MFDETAQVTEAFNTGLEAGREEERKKYIEAMRTMNAKIEELEDKHWEECRQIALYDDQLQKALALLGRVKAVHEAAIRNGDAAVSTITSRLLYEVEKLEAEVSGNGSDS